jgi:hypothetical protein
MRRSRLELSCSPPRDSGGGELEMSESCDRESEGRALDYSLQEIAGIAFAGPRTSAGQGLLSDFLSTRERSGKAAPDDHPSSIQAKTANCRQRPTPLLHSHRPPI